MRRRLVKVEFLSGPAPPRGFWEKLGCHARGRVALDERWAPSFLGWRSWGATLLVGSGGCPGITRGLYLLPESVWTRIWQRSGAVLGFLFLGRRKKGD